MDSDRNHQHDAVSSPSLNDETIATKRQKLIGTLTSLSLPTLPFDLIPEILYRLPVKLLVQFQCVCKSWNSIISDPKFAEKQLRLSNRQRQLVHTLDNYYGKFVLNSYPLDSVFANVTANPIAQLVFPFSHDVYFVGSYNGILCLLACDNAADIVTVLLWNPCIRKFKELPRFQLPQNLYLQMYGFGHDPITDNYKVVVVLNVCDINRNFVDSHEVKVHTLGTNSWKSIQKFPFGCVSLQRLGKFVCGTINWLVSKKYDNKIQRFIVSLNLGNESYKKVLLPEEVDTYTLHRHLGVLRDCLYMIFGHDVWIMKEHGNKDSWIKLFTISYMPDFPTSHTTIKVLHMFEDCQVLFESIDQRTWKFVFYNSRNGTFKFIQKGTFKYSQLENINDVCVESLISPCS